MQEVQSSALVRGASTYYFFNDNDDGYNVSSDCYSVFPGKISSSILKAPSPLYTTFILHLHHTRAGQIRRCWFFVTSTSPQSS